jgi:hypothetical protein
MTTPEAFGSRLTTRAAAATFVALLLAAVTFGPAAGADTPFNPNNFNLSAQAQSVDIIATVPGAPLITTYEASPYGASAALNSLGQSSADAGAPYAPVINTLLPLVNGLGSGSLPPLPPLPGYVYATAPTRPTDTETQGVYAVRASAGDTKAEGSVALGVTPAGGGNSTMFSSATASANPDGSVAVTASAGIDLLNLGGLVDIGNISSIGSMTKQAGHAPVYKVATSLGTVSLLGLSTGLLGLGGNAGSSLTPTLITTLNVILKAAGISLSYLPATYVYADGSTSTGAPQTGKVIQSVDSGALQVAIVRDVKDLGHVTVTTTLGRVFMSATDDPGVGPTQPGTGSTGSTGGSTGVVSQPVASGNGGAGIPPVVIPPTLPTGPSSAPQSAGEPGGTSSSRLASLSVLQFGPSAEGLYLILVLGSIAAVGAAQAVRLLAVRLAFTQSRQPS